MTCDWAGPSVLRCGASRDESQQAQHHTQHRQMHSQILEASPGRPAYSTHQWSTLVELDYPRRRPEATDAREPGCAPHGASVGQDVRTVSPMGMMWPPALLLAPPSSPPPPLLLLMLMLPLLWLLLLLVLLLLLMAVPVASAAAAAAAVGS